MMNSKAQLHTPSIYQTEDEDTRRTLGGDVEFIPHIPVDKTTNIIKVIGVGGGGSNAVRNMYNLGVKNVSFAVCNTDSQALSRSPIPMKVQLGSEGLGVGGVPERGRERQRLPHQPAAQNGRVGIVRTNPHKNRCGIPENDLHHLRRCP